MKPKRYNGVSEQGRNGILWTVFDGQPFQGRRIASFSDQQEAWEYSEWLNNRHFPEPPADEGLTKRPKIICLCGSSKFVAESAVKAWEFNKQGIATFFMPLLPLWYPNIKEHHQAEAEDVAANLDNLWLELIRMADEVFVVNCGGYIGERTTIEIKHAESIGKPALNQTEGE